MDKHRRADILAIALTLALVALTSVLLLVVPQSLWSSERPATCLATGCFCEQVDWFGKIRQPANTWSSLAFVIPGTIILSRLSSSGRRSKSWLAMMGLALIITGVGSAAYHATLSFDGQFWDVFGMYLTSGVIIFFGLDRYQGRQERSTACWFGFLAYVLASTTTLIVLPDLRRWLFAIFLAIGIAIEVVGNVRRGYAEDLRLFLTGIAIFAVAFVIWGLDSTKVLCAPSSYLQGHAIWHALGAVASYALYRYYTNAPKNGHAP